ncbi:MAG: tyrosine-type recombinase/integrase [Vicinamibacterales bacterium]|nr:tyrosine-type recombinase/integrase [Vicinamibacterales bacterium]
MLRIYRRHRVACGKTSTKYRRCSCPIYVEGSLGGEPIRKALDQTSWEAASDLVARWTASGEIGVEKNAPPNVKGAVEKFMADGKARGLSEATLSKRAVLLEKQLLPFCRAKGIVYLRQLDVDRVTEFRQTWKDSGISAYKKLERLKGFFHFCIVREWMKSNPAHGVPPPIVGAQKVKVFTPAQLEQILAAVDEYPTRNSFGHDNRARVRAFVLVLRYSGLRIRDVVQLRAAHLQDGRLFLHQQKTGTPVWVPVPQVVVDAVGKIGGGEYFFWTGNGLAKSAVADWQRTIRRLFELAGVDGHPHMFRHSFATELLAGGHDGKKKPLPIEDVSLLLGHSSVKITEKYYSHWISARRERLEEGVRQLWAS